MRFCPLCQTVYHEDDVFFCLADGTPLSENNSEPKSEAHPTYIFPPSGGNPPPNSFNQPPTVQFGQSDNRFTSETVTLFQPTFTPPAQPPRLESNSNKNIIIAVLATASVFLLIGMVFLLVNNYLISKETEIRPSSNTEREGNSGANNNSSSEDTSGTSNSKNDKEDNIVNKDKKRDEESDTNTPVPKSNDLDRTLPNNTKQQFNGTSYFSNGETYRLTLSLTRNGRNLSGSARTPGNLDYLNGTIQPNGYFILEGYNRNTSQVTGTWKGKINGNGKIEGGWISTINDLTASFYAQ